jgi:hypothetical protein
VPSRAGFGDVSATEAIFQATNALPRKVNLLAQSHLECGGAQKGDGGDRRARAGCPPGGLVRGVMCGLWPSRRGGHRTSTLDTHVHRHARFTATLHDCRYQQPRSTPARNGEASAAKAVKGVPVQSAAPTR